MENELEKSLRSIIKRSSVLDESRDDYRREENARELVQEVLDDCVLSEVQEKTDK